MAPLTVALVLVIARGALAACGDQAGDAEAVAAARAAARARCDCAAATNHATHVRCVAAVAREAVDAGQLRRQCRGAVVRCATRSTCGRPGTVACCRSAASGARRCGIKTPAGCVAPEGGSACASDQPSCCDACATGACASTTTTVPATTTTTLTKTCATDVECDDGNPCSDDRCVDGSCRHDCLCVGPTGAFTCCPGPAAECGTTWFTTCGDPVCGVHRDQGVRPCGPGETPGAPCAPEGATCDPGSDCNELLLCTTSDPTHGGQCPISRRAHKDRIQYLDAAGIRRLRDELMRFPLATYRYRDAASRTHLGFVIEDVEPSLSVDANRGLVDLYGYTTMAVAALQAQQREIETLRREVDALQRELRTRRRPAAK